MGDLEVRAVDYVDYGACRGARQSQRYLAQRSGAPALAQ
jgi:hypothetical protein